MQRCVRPAPRRKGHTLPRRRVGGIHRGDPGLTRGRGDASVGGVAAKSRKTEPREPSPGAEPHAWQFKPRFRRAAFGWKSQPAIERIGQAVAEIKKVARNNPRLGAEGAVLFLERLSPAIEQVDSSSGAIGSCVSRAISELAPIIAAAPAEPKTRGGWLERLFDAYLADNIPYIEELGDAWGTLCGSNAVASAWADRLLPRTCESLRPNGGPAKYSKCTAVCLSSLFQAQRFDELIDLVRAANSWSNRRWAVRAMAATGRIDEAIRFAEASRGPYSSDGPIDAECEELLLAAGFSDEAYAQYGIRSNQRGTYLATFRAIAKKYPNKPPRDILMDLARSTPREEGKWFAAAKDAGLFDEALALASRSPCDPKTLTRAAREFTETRPAFAVGAGLLAMHWLVQGYGYEITGLDVRAAYHATLAAAKKSGQEQEAKERIRRMVVAGTAGRQFVADILGRELSA